MIYINERPVKKLTGITSLFISFNYSPLIVEELKLLDTTDYNPETKEWEVPILSLSELLDRLNKIDSITLNWLPDIPKINLEDIQLLDYEIKPFPHQEEAIKFGLQQDNWLLLDAPGLGKSKSLIHLAEELRLRKNIQHCLIICGVNTLKTNWKKEIEKYSKLPCKILGQRMTRTGKLVIDGLPQRIAQLKEPIEEFFLITNIETLRNDTIIELLRKGKVNKFDMIVVDEIHTTKNPTSAQGKNLLKLNKAPYKIGATGTLLLNNPLDTYVPLKWIGAERGTYSKFKYYYCMYGGPFNNILQGFKNLDHLKYQLNQYSLRRTKDILGLPPKNIINEYVDMGTAQENFYEEIKEGIVAQVDKVKMSTANLLALTARLRQATALPSILTTNDINSAKIDRTIDLTQQLISNGEKVVIFSTFKEPVNKLLTLLKEYNPVIGTGDYSDFEIEEAKEKFQNDPNTKVFLGTWQKCGTGITLTAASYMIFIDTPWTYAVYEQAQDRIHRIGTNKPVFIYNLITKGTIDERVLEIVSDKQALSEYIIDDQITQQGLNSLRKYLEELI